MHSFHIKHKFTLLLLTLLLVVGRIDVAKGQVRTHAALLGLNNNTTNAGNATLDTENPATLKSTSGLGFTSAILQVLFANGTNVVPANTIVFVKINSSTAVTVTAHAGATLTHEGSAIALATNNILFTPDGNTYIAISAAIPFNSVKVTVAGALLGGTTAYMYYAFFNQNNPLDCGAGIAVEKSVNALLALGADVKNPLFAIDNDPTLSTAAFLTLGTLAVAGTVSENVYFSGPSRTGDAVRATFSIPKSLLNVGLLGNISIQAYSGNEQIGTPQSLSTLLSLDLLGLLKDEAKYTFYFVPSQAFDRVEFVVGGVVSILGGLNLYDVQRVPSPLIAGATPLGEVNACGTTTTISIANPQTGLVYNWYNAATGSPVLGTGTSHNVTGLTPGTITTYYVEAVKPGCSNYLRYPIQIKSIALPIVGPITGNNNMCLNQSSILNNSSIGGTWFSSDISIATINSSTGVISTISPGNTTITYTYTDPVSNCPNTVSTILTVKPLPTLTSNLTPAVCSSSAFSYTASSNVIGTSFSWIREAIPGISNTAGSGLTNTINETLTNITSTAITVTYIFSLTVNSCSSIVNVQLKVNPNPGPPHILSE